MPIGLSIKERSAGEEGDAGHDEQDAEPTDGGDGLVKDEDGGEEAEDVADANEGVGQGEVVVAKDVEPEEGGASHGEAGGGELPVEEGAAEEGPCPGEGEHLGQRELEEDLAGDEQEGLDGGEDE